MDSLTDLAERWRRARRAALRSALPESTGEEGDAELLQRGLAADAPRVSRAAFDNSLALGRSYARFWGRELTLGEVPGLLQAVDAPCAAGAWTAADDEPALRAERSPCSLGAVVGACDFWREAIEGLLLGVTGGARHARHASAGHGDPACVDVVYLDPESDVRFGPIPEGLEPVLERVRRSVRTLHSDISLEFFGVSEGVLYYEEKKVGEARSLGVSSLVERAVRRAFPRLSVREISPRPILSESA